MALKAFHVIGCAGMARVDFLMSKTEKQLYINEINTIPGFTNISMYPRLWQDSGLEYQQLLGQLIDLALNRHVKKQSLHTKLFSSQPTDHL
jgi:D-alanine-D-alanine ligase